MLAHWESETKDETWPWVWTWRNPNGPHQVFVGVGDDTLATARAFCSASDRHNLTLVISSIEDDLVSKGLRPADFYQCRCAIIEGEVEQIDAGAKMLMLRDERILCFDVLTLC